MSNTQLNTKLTDIDPDAFYGACPVCGRVSELLNFYRNHWFICHTHQTKWCAGSNLFSIWREQSDRDFLDNAERLSTYRTVEPVFHPDNLSPTEE